MKKFLKILVILVIIIIVVVGGALAYINISDIPKYEPKQVKLKVEVTPEKVEHGAKLSSMLCNHCHYNEETKKLTGRLNNEAPPEFGTIYSKNITNHKEAGIGNWTDGEIAFFLRTGIRPDGQYVPPYMPKLTNMADEDLEAIIAFLRSDHRLVQPSEEEPPETEPSFLTKMLCQVAFKPYELPDEKIEVPDTNDKVAYGKYLAIGRMECFSCHSADFKTNDYLNPENSPGYFGGGNLLYDRDGNPVYSANITMDEETGIGKWSEEDFVKTLRVGINPDGKALRFPMIPFPQLSKSEASAIYAYLKTLPEIENDVTASSSK